MDSTFYCLISFLFPNWENSNEHLMINVLNKYNKLYPILVTTRVLISVLVSLVSHECYKMYSNFSQTHNVGIVANFVFPYICNF